ncbi:MAG: response regulator [Chitinophagaceae bacterium]
MNLKGPIILVEDDLEDQDIMKEVFSDLKVTNEIKIFRDGESMLDYLGSTREKPFLILTDVNLPGLNGIMLRDEILKDEKLKKKSIPFILISTSDGQSIISKVYDQQVQGFFQKQTSFDAIKTQMKMILDYWSHCIHPGD